VLSVHGLRFNEKKGGVSLRELRRDGAFTPILRCFRAGLLLVLRYHGNDISFRSTRDSRKERDYSSGTLQRADEMSITFALFRLLSFMLTATHTPMNDSKYNNIGF